MRQNTTLTAALLGGTLAVIGLGLGDAPDADGQGRADARDRYGDGGVYGGPRGRQDVSGDAEGGAD